MKKLIVAALIGMTLSASAQTNIQVRVQVDGANSTLNLDTTGSKKDQLRIAGILFAYSVYTNSLATNAVALSKGAWLLRQHTVLIDDYATQKQASDNAALAAKLNLLLTTSADLLSNADITALNTIAAKLP